MTPARALVSRAWPYALAGLILLFAAGCASMSPPSPQLGRMYSPGSETALPMPELAQKLDRSRVVMVGEVHNHPEHHRIQLQVLRIMAAQAQPPVVGVEWVDASQQDACDRFSAGEISVKQFAREVNWDAKWGYPIGLYATLLMEIQNQGLRLVALSPPAGIIRQVARQGLESLDCQQRNQLARAMDLDDPAYRAYLAAQFGAHGMHGAMSQDNFMTAQIARDETMAQNMAQALAPWPDGGLKALILTGSGHLAHGLGLPPRISRRLPGASPLVVLPVALDGAAQTLAQAQPSPSGEYVFAVTKPAPPPRPRLGLVLNPVKEGLLVERVIPQTPADQAGVQAGDILVSVDGRPLKTVKDIHRVIRTKPYEPHQYRLLRSGKPLGITISLPQAKLAP